MFVVGEVICTYIYISGESEDIARLMEYRTYLLVSSSAVHLFNI